MSTLPKNVGNLKVTLFSGSYAVGGNGAAANDFDISDELNAYPWVGPVVLHLVWARTAGASTLDVVLTISLDGGTTYTAWKTFTQGDAASGSEVLEANVPAGALIKTDINLGASTTCTVAVYATGKVAGKVMLA